MRGFAPGVAGEVEILCREETHEVDGGDEEDRDAEADGEHGGGEGGLAHPAIDGAGDVKVRGDAVGELVVVVERDGYEEDRAGKNGEEGDEFHNDRDRSNDPRYLV